ncbi:MAG: NAD(P)H-hydrate dehydratase [Ignavibacteria bacterium]|nr:NAD(P)H-hydrate dehydratase [Ignavibacteria bacterium]
MKSVIPKEEFLRTESEICNSTGISTLVLMENAGRSCADFILGNFPPEKIDGILILTGKGNNAGDGFVIARHLALNGFSVNLGMVFAEDQLSGIAKENFEILKATGNSTLSIFTCESADDLRKEMTDKPLLIADCIFGTGFKGKLEGAPAEVIEEVNSMSEVTRIAVDIPSGLTGHLQDGICFRADLTLTMGALKFESLFHDGRKNSGEVHVMNIGIPESEFLKRGKGIFQTETEDIPGKIFGRDVTSNKYTNGKVLLISGSPGLSGATYLSALSAARTGCGAVIAAVPKSVFPVMEMKLTEVMKLQLADNAYGSISFRAYDQIREKLDWADVVLIGPGLSKNEESLELVRRIVIENGGKRFVIDADAVYAFRGFSNLLKGKDIILTPHFGEFAGVAEVESPELMKNFPEHAKAFSEKSGATLVLKNAPTIIAEGTSLYVNSTGNENLATAGTGDVLSGMIASLWARSGKRFESAVAGTLLHGIAGDLLYSESGPASTIASDLINKINEAKRTAGID